MIGQNLSNGAFSLGGDCWPGLGKVVEESSELLTEMGKLIATHGDTEYWGRRDLRKGLMDECADSVAAIAFFSEHNFTQEEQSYIMDRIEQKYDLFKEWHITKDG